MYRFLAQKACSFFVKLFVFLICCCTILLVICCIRFSIGEVCKMNWVLSIRVGCCFLLGSLYVRGDWQSHLVHCIGFPADHCLLELGFLSGGTQWVPPGLEVVWIFSAMPTIGSNFIFQCTIGLTLSLIDGSRPSTNLILSTWFDIMGLPSWSRHLIWYCSSTCA